jgi:hypothetical protein
MRKIMTVLMSISFLAFCQICQSDIASAGESAKADACGPAGVWKTKNDLGGEGIIVITPLDSTGESFSGSGEGISAFDPTFDFPFFPPDTRASKFYGIAVKTLPSGYKYTYYQYGVSQTKGKVWKLIASGESKGVDCDNSISAGTLEFFIIIGDKEYPWACKAVTGHAVRLTLVPPCSESSDFPE